MERNKGITLIALAVTIIVMLILAGATISILTNENGMMSQATIAREKNDIAKVEEIARLEYANLVMQKQIDGKGEETTLSEVKENLENKGYTVLQKLKNVTGVTGIEVNPNTAILEIGGIAEAQITFIGNDVEYKYYVEINTNYYEMQLENGDVSISRKKTKNIDGEEEIIQNLEVISDNSNIKAEINGTKIILTDIGNTGTTGKITVKYRDSITKELSVKVLKRPSEDSEVVANLTFSTECGKIDIIWLKGTSSQEISTIPNSPNSHLTASGGSLTPVKWNNSNELQITNTNDQEWYDYSKRKWANAQTPNGSFFVWIPRFAYRITYYSDENYTDLTGYYDGYGQWSATNGELRYKIEEDIETVEYNGEKYIVHPAFCSNVNLGGWDKPLEGIWVAKFTVSGDKADTLKFTYGAEIQRSQTIGKQYTNARTATYGTSTTGFMESHMMKNSEWGAVAYLTQSKYGLDGKEIAVNDKNYRTGGGSEDAYITNANQSTTGNVYGIYDMSGGAWEHVAAFNSVDTNNNFLSKGWTEATGLTINSASTKYATKYNNAGSCCGNKVVFETGITGDASKEVYTGGIEPLKSSTDYLSWFYDLTYITNKTNPFFVRGCRYSGGPYMGILNTGSTKIAGVFCLGYSGGWGSYDTSFRTVLCPD